MRSEPPLRIGRGLLAAVAVLCLALAGGLTWALVATNLRADQQAIADDAATLPAAWGSSSITTTGGVRPTRPSRTSRTSRPTPSTRADRSPTRRLLPTVPAVRVAEAPVGTPGRVDPSSTVLGVGGTAAEAPEPTSTSTDTVPEPAGLAPATTDTLATIAAAGVADQTPVTEPIEAGVTPPTTDLPAEQPTEQPAEPGSRRAPAPVRVDLPVLSAKHGETRLTIVPVLDGSVGLLLGETTLDTGTRLRARDAHGRRVDATVARAGTITLVTLSERVATDVLPVPVVSDGETVQVVIDGRGWTTTVGSGADGGRQLDLADCPPGAAVLNGEGALVGFCDTDDTGAQLRVVDPLAIAEATKLALHNLQTELGLDSVPTTVA